MNEISIRKFWMMQNETKALTNNKTQRSKNTYKYSKESNAKVRVRAAAKPITKQDIKTFNLQ